MIYLLYGNDFKKARENLHKMTGGLLVKKPDAELFKLDVENWSEVMFEELVFGQGLFEKKYIVILDSLFENEEIKDFILNKLDDLKKSESIFIFIEKKIDKATLIKIEKRAEKTQDFVSKDKVGSRSFSMDNKSFDLKDFNIFSLADALGCRNKKDLWVLYQRAIAKEASAEEIHGLLFWQLKSMLLAISSKSSEESGLKPYVFNKSKSFARNYSEKELKKMSGDLVAMYHDAHRGLVDFNVALEKWILEK